ncbi:DMT family transporter [Brucella intermedia]|uniref:DMT family transporter n=1 Tax=Brucella intermedia TaxID=94625 RepID=UPI0023603D52|nr:DMT family transporter [Brucella intermedia]
MSSDAVIAHRSNTNGSGILMMVLAMTLVPMIDVQAKYLVSSQIPALQVVFLRMLLGTLFLTPLMIVGRQPIFPPLQGWRNAFALGCFSVLAGICFFGSLRYLSIADAVAISFVQPLFVTLFSRLFLKEKVHLARWIGLVIGFTATLIIIRPTHHALEMGSLLALAAGAAMAGYVIAIKKGSSGVRSVPPIALTFQTHFSALIVAAPLMFIFWQGLDLYQWTMAVGMTLVGLAGQYLIIKAYHYGDVSLLAPFAYIKIITSTFFSWMFFAQVPDTVTFLGVSILIGSSVYVAWRR